LAGQRLAKPLPHWEPALQSSAPAPKTPTPDYRWEGAAVGAIGLGLFGAVLGNGICEVENCTGATVLFALGGAVVGGVTGGLIGSFIPKGP
jgi:hypothetical protein